MKWLLATLGVGLKFAAIVALAIYAVRTLHR
jgi:hypothetical protein